MARRRAVFLDRDGVLTKERPDYVKNLEELKLLPGISLPLKALRDRGFLLVVVTNQSSVGRGLITNEEIKKIHEGLHSELEKLGCKADGIYFCPHRPDEGCSCRKPEPGLILEAAAELGIDLSSSWMIGDKDTDVEAARKAGCRAVKIPTNESKLGEAVATILSSEESYTERAR